MPILGSASSQNCNTILAKVGSGDSVADEVKYHIKCFVNLQNQARNIKYSSKSDNKSDLIRANAFAEFVSFIEGHIPDCDNTHVAPVFKLSELLRFYRD